MKTDDFIDLRGDMLIQINGGSEFTRSLMYLLGRMFITPGKMAIDGAAGHEIMGSK